MSIISELRPTLEEIYAERAEFGRLFDYMASRRRNWAELIVDRLVDDPALDDIGAPTSRRKVIIEFFRKLEAAGAGKLIVGRGRRKTRFGWVKQMPMLEAAAAARGSERTVQVGGDSGDSSATQLAPVQSSAAQLAHAFALRPDYVVQIRLPADLTSVEADRLSAFVKALPFEGRRGDAA